MDARIQTLMGNQIDLLRLRKDLMVDSLLSGEF